MNPTISRRRFLEQAAAATLVSSGAFAEPKDQEAVFPIIDTHQHIWDLARFTLPWLKNAPSLNKNFLMADYLQAVADLGKGNALPSKIVKTVYMEVDVDPKQQQAEADYVVDICKEGKTPMVAAVISGRPASDGFAKYVAPYKASKYVKGLRQVLHGAGTPAGTCLGKAFISGIRLLGELGLSFDLCMRPAELPDATKLIDACPDTQFILDHCGNAVVGSDLTQWKKDLADLTKRKNVAGKVSGVVESVKPGQWKPDDLAPIVNHVLDSFGPDRVIFAGNWPVCTFGASLAEWVSALRAIVKNRKAEEQRKLFHDNAVRVYRLG